MARSLPATLIADTVLHETDGNADGVDQSRGAQPRPRRRRSLRATPGGKATGRKFQVLDTVFERLMLEALKRRSNPSAILNHILDRELPKHKIATEE
jgi:hypothetical protein